MSVSTKPRIESCGIIRREETLIAAPRWASDTSMTVTRTSFPLSTRTLFIPKTESNSVRPGGRINWYLSGPEGARFSTTLTFQVSGGHSHGVGTVSKFALGEISPVQGVLQGRPPQNLIQVYTAGPTCCQVVDRTLIADKVRENLVTIAVGGLQPLSGSEGVSLVGATPIHPSNHWGTARLCQVLQLLGRAFYRQFAKPIFVNDMSLITGGRFDIQGHFTPPHQSHADGRHADINRSSMTPEEQEWFRQKAHELGILVEEHGDPSHWHIQFD